MTDHQTHSDAAAPGYFDSPDFDPNRFMDSLTFLPDGELGDLPIPPRLSEDDDVVLVSRTYKLPLDVDAELRAAAAAQRISVEELLRRWTHDHHAA